VLKNTRIVAEEQPSQDRPHI